MGAVREGERTVEGAAGEAEAREGRRHVVVERDDADAEDRGGRPRRAGLRRLRGRHGRRGAGGRVCFALRERCGQWADSNEARRREEAPSAAHAGLD